MYPAKKASNTLGTHYPPVAVVDTSPLPAYACETAQSYPIPSQTMPSRFATLLCLDTAQAGVGVVADIVVVITQEEGP